MQLLGWMQCGWPSFQLFPLISHASINSVFQTQAVNAMQQPAAPPVTLETHPMNLQSPVPPTDPMIRKQVVQDLMAQMQGTYNFMQVRSWC